MRIEVTVPKHSTASLHPYILGWLALMGLFVITLPIAMVRVSSTQPFQGQPFRSETCKSQQSEERKAVPWLTTCATMKVSTP
jgi:hypothetical protein